MKRISEGELKQVCDELLKEVPKVISSHGRTDRKMDRRSALLRALYDRLSEKLGLGVKKKSSTGGFRTFEVAYRVALYRLLGERIKTDFDYRKIINDFLREALEHR